jgi:hypothetical protein
MGLQQRIIHPLTNFELETGRAQIEVFTSLEAITEADAVYVNSSGRVGRARADASSTMHAIGVAFEAIANAGRGRVVTHGPMRSDNYDASGRLGLFAWVSPTTAGGVTGVPPTSSGQIRQQVGVWRERRLLYVSLGGASQVGGSL